MFSEARRSSQHLVVVLLTAALLVPACSDDEVEPEPQVAFVEVSIGATVLRINEQGTVTGGSLSIPIGPTAISVRFLKADGSVESLVTAAEFELRVTTNNTGIATFTRGGPFNGTITGVAAGSTNVTFLAWHLQENHEDFATTTSLTVTP
jgi:hypothetical protein